MLWKPGSVMVWRSSPVMTRLGGGPPRDTDFRGNGVSGYALREILAGGDRAGVFGALSRIGWRALALCGILNPTKG